LLVRHHQEVKNRLADPLISLLSDPSPIVQDAATYAIKYFHLYDQEKALCVLPHFLDKDIAYFAKEFMFLETADKRVVEALFERLDVSSEPDRQAIAGFFGKHARNDSDLKQRLLDHLNGDNPIARDTVVNAFRKMQCPDAGIIAVLLRRLSVENDERVISSLITALGELKVCTDDVFNALFTQFDSNYLSVRQCAANILGRLASTNSSIENRAIALLNDIDNPPKLSGAVIILGHVGNVGEKIFGRLFLLRGHKNAEVRSTLLSAIRFFRSDKEPEIVEAIQQGMLDTDPKVRITAIKAIFYPCLLPHFSSPEAIDAIMKTVVSFILDASNLVRKAVAEFFNSSASHWNQEVFDVLQQRLSGESDGEPDTNIRATISYALCWHGKSYFTEKSLRDCLVSPCEDMRYVATHHARPTTPELRENLKNVLINDASAKIIGNAAISFKAAADDDYLPPDIIDVLKLRLAQKPDMEIQVAIIEALTKSTEIHEELEHIWFELLSDDNKEIRETARKALGHVGYTDKQMVRYLLDRKPPGFEKALEKFTEDREGASIEKILYMPKYIALAEALEQPKPSPAALLAAQTKHDPGSLFHHEPTSAISVKAIIHTPKPSFIKKYLDNWYTSDDIARLLELIFQGKDNVNVAGAQALLHKNVTEEVEGGYEDPKITFYNTVTEALATDKITLVPMNTGQRGDGIHWISVVINPKIQSIDIVDSINHCKSPDNYNKRYLITDITTSEVLPFVLQSIIAQLFVSRDWQYKDTVWKPNIYVHTPLQQADGASCGPFAVDNLAKLATGEKLFHSTNTVTQHEYAQQLRDKHARIYPDSNICIDGFTDYSPAGPLV
ncbi:MAG: hypothetical protein KAT71_05085, partial [Gammaproteobacteria bacterium]|nr:hypothetical protein [Gammaproteobacteria bacterium]